MNHHQNTAGNHDYDAQIANSAAGSERAAVRDVLTPDEIDLLGRYVGNNATQAQIGAEDKVAQTTVSFRVRRAVEKLKAAGLPTVSLPGKGRRPLIRDVAVDPRAIGRLIQTHGGVDGAGRARMKWKSARKTDGDQDNDDE